MTLFPPKKDFRRANDAKSFAAPPKVVKVKLAVAAPRAARMI
jgi:hypothetical protein